jgi:CHAT domain-containing protein
VDRRGRSGRLIELSAVRYVPNLTSLLLPWGGSSEGRVLAVGVKHFDDPAYESLWDAEAEAAAVAGIHGGRGDFASRLAREPYRCLHLATHGSSVLHGDAVDDPRLSSLSLRDGDLSAWDLSTLGVSAELVVLAACHSGQRAVFGRGLDALPGDDLFGLQAVFFEAGAWGVLGTLWPVDDETAREIMTAFHRAYASGVPPDAALQQAMAQYLTNPEGSPSPFMWAPFVLVTLGRHPGTPAS